MEPLKILWLSNSNDTRASISEGRRRPELMAAMLEAEIGVPVSVKAKPIWPSERLPAQVEGWMDEEQPDLVWMYSTRYPFAYESVPRRVERWFGRGGKKATTWGKQIGTDPRFANRAWFRVSRTLLQRAIGGDAAFPVETVIERMSATARSIVRKEDVVLIIEGPRAQNDYHQTKRAARRTEARRQRVHQALRELSRELRCSYVGSDRPLRETVGEPSYQQDKFHMDEVSHVARAKLDFPVLLDAVRKAGLDAARTPR